MLEALGSWWLLSGKMKVWVVSATFHGGIYTQFFFWVVLFLWYLWGYCLCVAPGPTASIPKASHLWLQAGIIVPGSWGEGAALPGAVFWLVLISIS